MNGTSSAGKTSLARELQPLLPEPYLYLGIDLFIYMLPAGYWNADPAGFTLARTERGTEIKVGPVGLKLQTAMLDTISTLARTGHNLIVDDVILNPLDLSARLRMLHGLQFLLVKVFCPFVVAQQRERDRGDRATGFVQFQYPLVEALGRHDFEVNTAEGTPLEGAFKILGRLELGWPDHDDPL